MAIAYSVKRGILYAVVNKSYREGNKVKKTPSINLGRVLDKEKGIYHSKERGVFTYDMKTETFGKAPADFVPSIKRRDSKEKLIVDFGDAFVFDSLFSLFGLRDAVDAIGYGNPDSLYALLLYYIIEKRSNSHAESWYNGSYARILYPKANLTSQRISDLLESIGNEYSQRAFFREYFKILGSENTEGANILIDSTGLQNSVRFPLTAVSNHNGEISEEVRLIYVVQQGTRLPIYMRYVPGNVIDTTTLVTTIKELKQHGIKTKYAILDAGYLTKEGMSYLFEHRISFITRSPSNRVLYKKAVELALPNLEEPENIAIDSNGRLFNKRQVYVKRVELDWKMPSGSSKRLYAYVCKDKNVQEQERKKTLDKMSDERRFNRDELHFKTAHSGIFVLLSSRAIMADKVLNHYYIRQDIEQVFDISKNYASLLPLNIEKETTFRGHLLMTFISTIILQKLQNIIRPTKYSIDSILVEMRTQKAKIFEKIVIPSEPVKKQREIYKLLDIKLSKEYPTSSPGRE